MTRIPPKYDDRLGSPCWLSQVLAAGAGPGPGANFTGPEDFSALAEARLPA